MTAESVVKAVEAVTFGRVKGQHLPRPSLRWWYTPWAWSAYFGASGWVCLSWRWLLERHRYEAHRRRRMREEA